MIHFILLFFVGKKTRWFKLVLQNSYNKHTGVMDHVIDMMRMSKCAFFLPRGLTILLKQLTYFDNF